MDDWHNLASTITQSGYGFTGEYISLNTDLDFSTTTEGEDKAREFVPIATPDIQFNGTFLGNDHTISGISIDSDTHHQGIFVNLGPRSLVKGLKIDNVNIKSTGISGLLAAVCYGTVEDVTTAGNCSVECINAPKNLLDRDGQGVYVGGIVGQSKTGAVIRNCVNRAQVTGVKKVGGVLGAPDLANTSDVSGCTNYGAISATAPQEYDTDTGGNPELVYVEACAGGIVGYLVGSLTDNTNHGPVSTTQCNAAGGIAGYSYRTVITGNTNDALIRSARDGAGGIVGMMGWSSAAESTIRDNHNTGEITGYSSLGGILGATNGRATLSGCTNRGFIHGSYEYVGGIIGYGGSEEMTVKECINLGEVRAPIIVGGIIGANMGHGLMSFEKCFNAAAVTATAPAGQVGGIANGHVAISKSYNVATITGQAKLGGLAGTMGGEGSKIDCSYNSGAVIFDGNKDKVNTYGHIVGDYDVYTVITNAYWLNDYNEDMMPVDITADLTGITGTELCKAPLGTDFVYNDQAFPMLAEVSEMPEAIVNAAYIGLGEGQTLMSVSSAVALCSSLEGVTWSASGALELTDATTASPRGHGDASLTVTCGELSRIITLKVVEQSGINTVDTDSDDSKEYYNLQGVRIERPLPGQIVITRRGEEVTKRIGR